jgi:glycosyltransferase involved in cell wall biosynthesis
MQSLAYAKPIITSDLPCFKEIQEREPCMRLFRAGDTEHFTACLKGVLKNPIGQNEMSERAHRYAVKYSWKEAAKKTLEVYNAALRDDHS